jgi:hypothetical protein
MGAQYKPAIWIHCTADRLSWSEIVEANQRPFQAAGMRAAPT